MSWHIQRDLALAEYYAARAKVSETAERLRLLGIDPEASASWLMTEGAKATQCSCGQWVARASWNKDPGAVTCEACTAKHAAAVREDERLEAGDLF